MQLYSVRIPLDAHNRHNAGYSNGGLLHSLSLQVQASRINMCLINLRDSRDRVLQNGCTEYSVCAWLFAIDCLATWKRIRFLAADYLGDFPHTIQSAVTRQGSLEFVLGSLPAYGGFLQAKYRILHASSLLRRINCMMAVTYRVSNHDENRKFHV